MSIPILMVNLIGFDGLVCGWMPPIFAKCSKIPTNAQTNTHKRTQMRERERSSHTIPKITVWSKTMQPQNRLLLFYIDFHHVLQPINKTKAIGYFDLCCDSDRRFQSNLCRAVPPRSDYKLMTKFLVSAPFKVKILLALMPNYRKCNSSIGKVVRHKSFKLASAKPCERELTESEWASVRCRLWPNPSSQ